MGETERVELATVVEVPEPEFHVESGIMSAKRYEVLQRVREETGNTVSVVGTAS